MTDAETKAAAAEFTVLDWIGTLFASGAIVALLAFPAAVGSFAAMYSDFGDVELPLLTRMVLRPWVPPLLAVAPLVLLVLGLRPQHSLRRRRLFVVSAFVVACLLAALCVAGVWMPMFELAGAVRAE